MRRIGFLRLLLMLLHTLDEKHPRLYLHSPTAKFRCKHSHRTFKHSSVSDQISFPIRVWRTRIASRCTFSMYASSHDRLRRVGELNLTVWLRRWHPALHFGMLSVFYGEVRLKFDCWIRMLALTNESERRRLFRAVMNCEWICSK